MIPVKTKKHRMSLLELRRCNKLAKRRIKRPKEQENLYRELINSDEFGIFSTYKDVFMLSGVVGFMENKRKEFNSQAEGINWNIFNLDTDEPIINAVALAETDDLKILLDDDDTFDRKMTIFEEYAAGGLEIVYKKVMDNPKNALNNYYDFILSVENELSGEKRNVKELSSLIFETGISF